MFASSIAPSRNTTVSNESHLKQSGSSARDIGIFPNATKILNLQRNAGNQAVLRMWSIAKPAPATAPPIEGDAEEEKPVPQQTGEPAPEDKKTKTEKAPPNLDPDGQGGTVEEEQFQPLEF